MGKSLNIVTPLHKKTLRNYLDRMINNKVECMIKAREYEFDYWDGDRKYGYGGYHYNGHWIPAAKKLIEQYNLTSTSQVLDVGCGKAHLLYEIKKVLPGIQVQGIDISIHGLKNAPKEVKDKLRIHRAQDPLPWQDKSFDLVLSLGTLHNLKIFELEKAIKEIERVGKQKYIMVESYKNKQELFNL